MPIFMAMERFRVPHNTGNMVGVTLARWAVSIAVAALSYEFVEKPILHYKARYQFHAKRPT
jgi:peptidoglycan/LPS O-acetylase OafA/YrhL